MYLKCNKRKKDGKEHRYWSIVESFRTSSGKVHQRQVLYLGEINDSQQEAWRKSIDVLAKPGSGSKPQQMSLFPEDRRPLSDDTMAVQVKLNQIGIENPRQFGGCWLVDQLWHELQLDRFWKPLLPKSREGTSWLNVLKTLTSYNLLSGGSEWKLHRKWFAQTAMKDLLNEDDGLVQKDKLYRCLDKLIEHKDGLFKFLQHRWKDLFAATFDVLLFDLTSTYFESDMPAEGLRQYGYSRDKRGDCTQVVIALIVTPQGFPLTYEVMPGNTADSSTLRQFVAKIETLYGKANRTWVMDRGIPTEKVLAEMRDANIHYLVGTPKGRLTRMEQAFLEKSWQEARPEVLVKVTSEKDELFVLVQSEKRLCKEAAMRRKRLKAFWKRLIEIRAMKNLTRDKLLEKIGAAKQAAGKSAGLIKISLPSQDEAVTSDTFRFEINKPKLKAWRRKEGRYLLRSNMTSGDPAEMWSQYIILTEIEQAFKELKHDLAVRPIYHHKDTRIEAHIFVAFLAYCLNVTLKAKLKRKAVGLTAKEVVESLSTIQMVDVVLPTTEGQTIVLPRITKPQQQHQLILQILEMTLPNQPDAYMRVPEAELAKGDAAASVQRDFGFDSEKRQTKRSRPLLGRMPSDKMKCRGDLRHRSLDFKGVYPNRPP